MAPATTRPPDSNNITGFSPDLWNQHDHWWQQEPETSVQTLGCRRAMDPVMASSCSPDPDITMVPGGSMYHSHLYGPGYSLALGHQHSPRWLIRSQATIRPLVATGATDINADPAVAVGPQTRTWPSAAARAWTTPVQPWTPTRPQVEAQIPDFRVTFSGNMGLRLQHGSRLW